MIRRYLELRRWRRAVRPGDLISLKPTISTKFKVHFVEGKEVTVYDPFSCDYETYSLRKIYPPKY